MEKIFGPRGSGLTWSLCEYAIEHGYDIIEPSSQQVKHCVDTIKKICNEYKEKYTLVECTPVSDHRYTKIRVRMQDGYLSIFKVWSIWSWQMSGRARFNDYYLIDNLEEFVRIYFNTDKFVGYTVTTYDPADVVLHKKEYDECHCDTLL